MAASLTRSLAIAVCAAGVLRAQPPRPRTQRAEVSIALAGNRATVEERFEFVGNPGALSFEQLRQRCAAVGPIHIASNGAAVPLSREMNGPWLRLHDTSDVDPARSSLGYTVTYDVELSAAEVSIPVLLPLAVLQGSRRGDPLARVTVTGPATTRVIAPRLARADSARWSARMAALPAAVRVGGLTPNAVCSLTTHGESGRFKLIFWSLVATLALWVPTYLWWANRQQHNA